MKISELTSNFVQRWTAAVERGSNPRTKESDDSWEGLRACKELKRLGLVDAVLFNGPTRNWRKDHVVKQIIAEVNVYIKVADAGVTRINDEFDTFDTFLQDAEQEFMALKRQFRLPELQRLAARCLERLREYMQRAEREKKAIWERRFNVAIGAFDLKYRNEPLRDIDLDTRFQVGVAAVLRGYLPRQERVSFRTICRLVVLVYIAAQLAEEQSGELVIKNTRRKLYVPDVDQRLRRANLHKEPGSFVD